MKKLIPFLIIMLLLASCNMPGRNTAQPDLVATNVELALTNAPTQTPINNINQPITMTNTPVPPTPTTLPITDAPTTAPATLAPTEPPAASPTPEPAQPTATAAPTQTEAPIAGDPADALGSPSAVNGFDQAGNWAYEDDQYDQRVSEGFLRLTSKGEPWWNSWYTIQPALKDFYYEVTIRLLACQGQDRSGIAFRLKDNNFYFMGLRCDGTWAFERYTDKNQIVTILDYKTSTALKPVGEWNRIGVMAKGDKFSFYINGVLVDETTDGTLTEAGTYGFISRAYSTISFHTQVDVMRYWVLN